MFFSVPILPTNNITKSSFAMPELFVAKVKEITKPACFTGNLEDLEIYYQKINMYYSFSKIFKFLLFSR